MIHGLISTLMVGVLGAAAAEVIRVIPALRKGIPPNRWELVASFLLIMLGAGAALFGWEEPQSAWKIAVLGAAFPLLFSSSVDALTSRKATGTGDVGVKYRSIPDYVAGRY